MEDTIEICSGCGKMPRAMDAMSGSFVCSRCGNSSKVSVKADDYERIASELDRKFHAQTQKTRIEAAADHPVELSPRRPPAARKKTAKKASPKKTKARPSPRKAVKKKAKAGKRR